MKPFLVLLLSLLCSPCWAQWTWSPRAEHHKAAVAVRWSNGAGGSGVVVKTPEGLVGVLTAAHVVEGSPRGRVVFHDGTSLDVTGTHDKTGSDVAFLLGPIPSKYPRLSIAQQPPSPGSRTEVVSYGGHANLTLRHFYGTCTSDGRFSNAVLNGDSGAGVLNDRHEVVSIQSYGVNAIGQNEAGWPIYKPSGGARWQPIRNFARRVHQKFHSQCGPDGCYRGGGVQWGIQWGRERGSYPPADGIIAPDNVQPPTDPVPPQVASAPKLEIGETVTVGPGEPARVEMRLESDKYVLDFYIPRGDRGAEGQAGSQGVAGPAGPPGPQGPAGSGGEIDANAIAALIKQQVEQGVALQIQHGLAGVDDKIDSKLAGLPPLRFRHVVKDKDGNVVEVLRDDLVPLGGQLDFHFREKE